jgi:nitroreductase
MELKEAIAGRKSIRDFKPDPVSKELIGQVLEAAIKAPSNSNRQPWEFLVATGNTLAKLVAGIDEAIKRGGQVRRELMTRDEHWPAPEPGTARSNELMRGMVEAARAAGVAPAEFIRSNFRFFGAPCVVVVLMDKGYGTGSLVSVGAAIENLLLAAHDLGLASCWMMIPLEFSEVFRSLFSIPEGKYLVSTVAMGYASASKINSFKSTRSGPGEVIKFFD